MGYRLIALDLDGTALDTGKRLRPATRAAVAEAAAKGIRTIVVTGRHHLMARAYHESLALTTPLIACNGACVYDFVQGRPLVARPLDGARTGAIVSAIRHYDVRCHLYTTEAVYHENNDDPVIAYIDSRDDTTASMMEAFRLVDSFERMIEKNTPILKLVIFNPDRRRVEDCLPHIPTEGLSCEWSWAFGVDVTAAGNTKGRALIEWAATQGIGPEEIVAFGDNHNDTSMLTSVGLGVAMANAEPEVRAAAARVAGDNDGDSIAEIIRREVLPMAAD